jgi:O-antigen biosynthesis protein
MSSRSLPSQDRRAVRLFERLVTVLEREGASALARRKLSGFLGLIAERSRLWRMRPHVWRRDDRPVFLMISHRCGGGTERQLGDLETALRTEGVRPIVVRPGQRGRVLWEEGDGRGSIVWCRESRGDRESIAKMLEILRPAHAHIHHSMGLPDVLFDLLREQSVPYDWTIHDYYTICPRVNLIGAGGRYCGEPDDTGCSRCLARLGDDQGRAVSDSIVAWRTRSAGRLARARRVFAPSADVARRLARYFPGEEVILRPHAEALPRLESLAAPLRAGESVRVAVIGTLVAVKGADRLYACARAAMIRRLPLEFHVIGSTDRDAALARLGNVRISGRYQEREVYDRLAASRCHLAFLPSECPESYMYTLSIAMAARLFVVCFDLGAQAERVRAWGWGRLFALDLSPEAINEELMVAARSLAASPAPPEAPEPAQYPEALKSYYNFTQGQRNRLIGVVTGNDRLSAPHAVRGRDHARLH